MNFCNKLGTTPYYGFSQILTYATERTVRYSCSQWCDSALYILTAWRKIQSIRKINKSYDKKYNVHLILHRKCQMNVDPTLKFLNYVFAYFSNGKYSNVIL